MRVLVAVIAFNEERNLPGALADLAENAPGFDVVVIDNASSDGTVDVARERGVPVVSHCVNSGGAHGTIKTYLQYAYHYGYDVVCQFDGDGQHLATELPRILDPVRRGEADIVIGSRFIEKRGFQSSVLRRMGIRLFSYLDSLLTGTRITDVTSGFRAFSRSVMRFHARCYRHEIVDNSQLLLLSHFAGARIQEVPVVMRERVHGTSEYQFWSSIQFVLAGLANVLGCSMQRRRLERSIRDAALEGETGVTLAGPLGREGR